MLDRHNNYSFLLLLFILVSLSTYSQMQTSSPFSRYGMGVTQEATQVQNRAMGNSGIGLRDNKHINFMNAASYTSVDSLTFLFETGISTNFYSFSENGQKASSTNNGLDYISLSFPVTRWWGTAFGVLPYSKVGYAISESDTIMTYNNQYGEGYELVQYNYTGKGGHNQLIFGNSFKFHKFLSFGANVMYVFGESIYNSDVSFQILNPEEKKDKDGKVVDTVYKVYPGDYDYETQKIKTTQIKDFLFDFGLQFHYDINKKSHVTLGVTYSPKQYLKYSSSSLNQSISVKTGLEEISTSQSIDSTTEIPTKIGFGLSYKKQNKFIATADFYNQNWSRAKIYGNQSSYLKNEFKVGGGIEFIPNLFAPRGYLNKIGYKIGGYYKSTNIQIPDPVSGVLKPVTDFGISFGLEFPFRKTKNTFSISAQAGQKGTNSANIIKEQYILLNFNLTLNETWFYKVKID